ncbi:MAG: DUF4160 domain-containing protein [Cyanobacteria bacterium J06598_1]
MGELYRVGDLRIEAWPGDHNPLHVHVSTKNNELEAKIDISGDEVKVLRPAKNERIRTNSKHTKRALKLCQENLEYLQEAVRKYYDAQ